MGRLERRPAQVQVARKVCSSMNIILEGGMCTHIRQNVTARPTKHVHVACCNKDVEHLTTPHTPQRAINKVRQPISH